ncbi:MAG: AAA family ATPase [Halieaceae bacterium]|nr:AAA family ATPase [Halieaceae bacterium]
MYLEYFGLSEAPFSIAVNPRYLYLSSRHKEALAHLLYGVAGGGFVILTGEVGTGKTTLNRYFLAQLPDTTDIATIQNPALSSQEFLASACDAFGIRVDSGASLKILTDKLREFLLQNHAQGRRSILMVDEAQHLELDVLEQVRLLTNLETDTQKLLQIVLIGQPELMAKLNKPELRQLNQRITGRYKLGALTLDETSEYIQHRLSVAGMAPGVSPFSDSCIRAVHERTGGVPRLINLLCDRVLVALFGKQKRSADKKLAHLAAQELWQTDGEVQVRTGSTKLSRRPWAILASAGVLAFIAVITWYQLQSSIKAESASVAASAEPVATSEVDAGKPMPIRVYGELKQVLWQTYDGFGQPCANNALLRCVEATQGDWQSIARLNRPVILSLLTPLRERHFVLVDTVSLDGGRLSDVTLISDNGPVQADLEELASLWTGDYLYVWRPPMSFDAAVGLGSIGLDVVDVAQRFGRYDKTNLVLADEVFTQALHERVIQFQAEQGLKTDGMVGRETLVALAASVNERPSTTRLLDAWRGW